MPELELPPRYEPLTRLGKGGGGEVWAVRDRHNGQSFALKVLAIGASEREMAALVREAVALSGLEGLGVPRVVRFGRLPGTQRPFLVRELVEGRSLEELISQGAELARTLDALARAADQLTVLHRAGLLHGDVKPANIIVQPSGAATLVDLGLAAPWREGGATGGGAHAALRRAGAVRGQAADGARRGVRARRRARRGRGGGRRSVEPRCAERARGGVRARHRQAPGRALPVGRRIRERAAPRRGGCRQPTSRRTSAALWPVVGIDATSAQVLELIAELGPGGVLQHRRSPGVGSQRASCGAWPGRSACRARRSPGSTRPRARRPA